MRQVSVTTVDPGLHRRPRYGVAIRTTATLEFRQWVNLVCVPIMGVSGCCGGDTHCSENEPSHGPSPSDRAYFSAAIGASPARVSAGRCPTKRLARPGACLWLRWAYSPRLPAPTPCIAAPFRGKGLPASPAMGRSGRGAMTPWPAASTGRSRPFARRIDVRVAPREALPVRLQPCPYSMATLAPDKPVDFGLLFRRQFGELPYRPPLRASH
jgi:hypothetical protein